MIQELLMKAINHERMRQRLTDLNRYFYNRKHETQIRDELVIILNEIGPFAALSEHPKIAAGAVDLSLYEPHTSQPLPCICTASIELKHHYPKDLLYRQVQEDILSDITRKVAVQTTHFIHIIQQRSVHQLPSLGAVKYLGRNADSISDCVSTLENLPAFISCVLSKQSIAIEVPGDITSVYTFNVYTLGRELHKTALALAPAGTQ